MNRITVELKPLFSYCSLLYITQLTHLMCKDSHFLFLFLLPHFLADLWLAHIQIDRKRDRWNREWGDIFPILIVTIPIFFTADSMEWYIWTVIYLQIFFLPGKSSIWRLIFEELRGKGLYPFQTSNFKKGILSYHQEDLVRFCVVSVSYFWVTKPSLTRRHALTPPSLTMTTSAFQM